MSETRLLYDSGRHIAIRLLAVYGQWAWVANGDNEPFTLPLKKWEQLRPSEKKRHYGANAPIALVGPVR